MTKQLHFISGMPRTGSTLLVNVLAQNPDHFVTPTSGLIHLVRSVMKTWPECQEFRAQGLENAKPYVLGGLRGLMTGFFEQPLAEGQVVFDKSRGWLHYIEQLEEILGERVKVVTLVRDVRAVVGSFEKVYRRRGIEFRYPEGADLHTVQSVESRARRALKADRVTGRSILRLRDALQRCPDRLLLVPYRHFTMDPQGSLDTIHDWLGLPKFKYDTEHVEQVTHEDDNYLGVDLHHIRPKIEPQEKEPWKRVLPAELEKELAEEYADINRLSSGGIVEGVTLK